MKKTVNQSDFIKSFENRDNFTRKGLINLFNYFEELDKYMELDAIAICCEYSEYSSIRELKAYYGIPFENKEDIKEYLENRTEVIIFKNDCIIIRDF